MDTKTLAGNLFIALLQGTETRLEVIELADKCIEGAQEFARRWKVEVSMSDAINAEFGAK